jgi:hypothetical protein
MAKELSREITTLAAIKPRPMRLFTARLEAVPFPFAPFIFP